MLNFGLLREWRNWAFVLFVCFILCIFGHLFADKLEG